jgi:hypothetical protein
MSDNSDTSAIDEKNLQNTSQSSKQPHIVKFIGHVVLSILIVLLYFSLGGIVLYGCKLGQSNILPTEYDCYPYSETKPQIQPIQTNIFTTFTDPQMSMKMNFPYDNYNSSNFILDLFRKYKEEPKSNYLANYFISIIEALIHTNYSSLNYILNLLNRLPEILIIFFGPIIMPFLIFLVFLYDNVYLIYLWFSKMGWLFKQNKNDDPSKKGPQWVDVSFTEPVDYACAIGLIILFIMIFFFFLLPTLAVLPFVTMTICVFSCMAFKAQMDDKTINALTVIQYLLKYYKISFMTIVSIFVISSAFSYLGTVSGVFSIVTLALIYFGVISIDIFKPNTEENLSKLVSYEQAKKVCNFKKPFKQEHGFLYDLIFGQSGGGLSKELKKIGKRLEKK